MSRFAHLASGTVRTVVLFMAVLTLTSLSAEAHAILKSSAPTNGESVTGPDVQLKLTFNVRIDAARSKLQLLMPDASTIDLPVAKRPSQETLVSKASGLKPGAYAVRWQVLAPDGHITRGEIPFTVRNH